MTLRTNARVAGCTFLLYIVFGIGSLIISGRASSGVGAAEKLASIAAHTFEMRVVAVLAVLTGFSAVILGVTLYAITRDEDPEIAMLALICRVIEGVNNSLSMQHSLTLVWLATATGAAAPDPSTVPALGSYVLYSSSAGSALFFSVGSTLFSWLLLRGRMIPAALAWLGVVASGLVVVLIPLQLLGFLSATNWGGLVTWLTWMPLLVFELTFAGWLIVKGVAPRARSRS
jgi:hypothetical protein